MRCMVKTEMTKDISTLHTKVPTPSQKLVDATTRARKKKSEVGLGGAWGVFKQLKHW